MAIRVMLKSSQRVASADYSKKCKFFLFSRDMIKNEWLDVVKFLVVKNQSMQSFELLGLLVAKISIKDNEACIDPEPVPFTSQAEVITIQKQSSNTPNGPY